MTDLPNHDLIEEAGEALAQTTAEGRYHSAEEWLFVLHFQVKLARHTSGDNPLTAERRDLVESLSWALYDAVYGHCDRVADDLLGVEDLAESIQLDD
jgi:hypothetical protein